MERNFAVGTFFDLTGNDHLSWLLECQYPWQAIQKLGPWLSEQKLGTVQGSVSPQAVIDDKVSIGEGSVVDPFAVIIGPAIIGKNCHIRSHAYLRGNVYVGDNSVVGHTTEVKNSILVSTVRADHFNYIGDSILGNRTHLGAGVILANTKVPAGEIVVRDHDKSWPTGLEKFGSVLGDGVEIGCNAVLNPGSIIGKGSVIYPLVLWRGVLESEHIAKTATSVVAKK
ncbi:MAG: hypothetical protein WC817_00475 [Patescibacteria group bacterium]|jgi:NDP-sugar pyrophosphorylase family protein